MEVIGAVISRPIPSVSGGGRGIEPQPRYAPFSATFCGASVGIQPNSSASGKSSRVCRVSNSVFSDQSHMEYYSSGRKITCRVREGKDKVKGEKDMIKKELKRIEVLSKGLALHSRMDSYSDNVLIDPLKAGMISEAAEYLQGQLQQLRLKEKRLKESLREEKRRLRADKMRKILTLQGSSTSSSESSDSSDSDCGPVGMMSLSDCKPQGIAIQIPDNQTLTFPSTISMPQEEETTTPDISRDATSATMVVGNKTPVTKKIEVCMGGKCKKSGSALVMEKFQGLLDDEAVVCGCKCMGKCRDGPNVRITENLDMEVAANHLLHIGVGLEDVDLIVENLLGRRSQEKLDLAAASWC